MPEEQPGTFQDKGCGCHLPADNHLIDISDRYFNDLAHHGQALRLLSRCAGS
jgi:hypothetical protein